MLKSSLSMNANFNSAVLAEQVGVIFIASPSASGMKKKVWEILHFQLVLSNGTEKQQESVVLFHKNRTCRHYRLPH